MKTEELAAALEGQSIDHTPCDDCAVLRDAAKRLRHGLSAGPYQPRLWKRLQRPW